MHVWTVRKQIIPAERRKYEGKKGENVGLW